MIIILRLLCVALLGLLLILQSACMQKSQSIPVQITIDDDGNAAYLLMEIEGSGDHLTTKQIELWKMQLDNEAKQFITNLSIGEGPIVQSVGGGCVGQVSSTSHDC